MCLLCAYDAALEVKGSQYIAAFPTNTATHSSLKVDHCGPYANECGGGTDVCVWGGIIAKREQQSERRLGGEEERRGSGGRDRMMMPRG